MATLNALKKQIAVLQARVDRVSKSEMGSAIAKIRTLMRDSGVTIEHLMSGPKQIRTSASVKTAGVKTKKKSAGKKPAKYIDPTSGATWSGLGRIPAWIAHAKNRDSFLIDKPAASREKETVPSAIASPVKRAALKRTAKAPRSPEKAESKVASKRGAASKKSVSIKKASAEKPVSNTSLDADAAQG